MVLSGQENHERIDADVGPRLVVGNDSEGECCEVVWPCAEKGPS